MTFPAGYSIREMTKEEFGPLWQTHSKTIFGENHIQFPAYQRVSEAERAAWDGLIEKMGPVNYLRLGVFHGTDFVGWHIGLQESGEKFYMQNSAILPEHRKKGLYSALLAEVISRVQAMGFQIIYSRHNATNNAVIIPKLKAGFIINSMELSDRFGTLVHLSYFTNPLRRQIMEFRSGERRPDEEMRKALEL